MQRTILILLLLTLSSGGALWAQDEPIEETDPFMEEYTEPYVLQVGAYIGLAAGGINIETIASGRKVNSDFWAVPNFGASIYAPFGAESRLGGRLDIGVSTTGSRMRPYEFFHGETNWEEFVWSHT